MLPQSPVVGCELQQSPCALQPLGPVCAFQLHCPVDVLQMSQLPGGGGWQHETHWAPLMPHVSLVSGSQVPGLPGPKEQQPFGQLAALQTQRPLTQALPAGQPTHCAPK
jgi:hypothetical protein